MLPSALVALADGAAPRGLQPGGGGEQSGVVQLSEQGEITLPPELSMAVGQIFTDDDIAGFESTVNAGDAGTRATYLHVCRDCGKPKGNHRR